MNCAETPVWTPSSFDPSTLPPCVSCKLRLSCLAAGPGSIQASVFGYTVDENPTTVLTINGIQYSLIKSELVLPGLHRLYGRSAVCDMEYVLTFRNTSDISKTVLFCIPIAIGVGQGNSYFTKLGIIGSVQPVLTTLVTPDTAILTYPGASIYGRTKNSAAPTAVCAPVAYPVTYYVLLKPAFITSTDYTRLRGQVGSQYVGGPAPNSELTQTRATSMLTYISSIALGSGTSGGGGGGREGGVSTSALKCYKIDPTKDVKGDKVYIGGAPNENTLAKELQAAASSNSDTLPDTATVQPGDIEQIIGIVVGVLLAVFICAIIAYNIWKGTFSKYLSVLKLYRTPPEEAAAAAAAATENVNPFLKNKSIR